MSRSYNDWVHKRIQDLEKEIARLRNELSVRMDEDAEVAKAEQALAQAVEIMSTCEWCSVQWRKQQGEG